ncbi:MULTISPECIES: NAD(P)H-binding protein [Rhodococcus]|uniref:NAD(P)H-binding protein n=1 Tax=Rhodococcus TaxID=1827 RepID=UPI00045CD6A4|nr:MULTISPECIES: NAD(P)H-binding protein [Rhodococcus]KDE14664.1 NmrA family transcriptional regulator [Rhodococcus aetherivorans]PND49514.1 NmrA family transcriptional regulator [Rhodococcus sp. ENV425]WKW99504.1 NAD(P)H-binding protein [Rhodococcus aetherivorans]
MDERPVLVLGSTGTVGRRVTRQLRERGHAVRAGSRSGDVPFDWFDPHTWKPAVSGAGAVFVMAPDGVPVADEFVDMAVAEGISRFVLLSSKAVDVMGDERLLAAERAVTSSGAEWTVVRPDWFDQNFDEGFLRAAVLAGEIVLPLGDMRQAFNDAGDIAAVAVAALTGDGHAGRTYELSGPDALSFGEAAAVIACASGREVRYRGEPDAYLETMTGLGLDRAQVLAEIEAFEALRATGDATPNDVVAEVAGRPPVSFETYVRDAAERGAWA